MNKNELRSFLNNEIKENKVLHSYLFYGEKIEEFKEEILLFLKEVSLKSFEKENKDRIDKIKNNIDDGIINDFRILDGKSIKVSDVRTAFEDIYEKPFLLDKKIYFIENFDELNINSQNAMLKILEEPPHFVIIVLLSQNMNNILDTIKSRCLKIYLNNESENNESGLVGIDLRTEEDEKYSKYRDIFKDIKRMPKSIYYAKYNKIINKDEIKDVIVYLEKLISYNIEELYIYTKVIKKIKEKISGNLNFEMIKDYMILNMYEAK